MTRKVSAYARKMRRRADGGTYNGAQWLNTIQDCRAYTETAPIPGSYLPGGGVTASVVTTVALRVRAAFDALRHGQVAADDVLPHDTLAHALGVAWLRALDIAGDDPARNPMLPMLRAATEAVLRMGQRRRQVGRWGLDGPGLKAVADGLDVYEEILANSSPAQMAAAAARRLRLLALQEQKQTTHAA